MKKFLLTLPTLIFPYFLLFELFCLFTGFLMEELFDSFFLVMIFYILLFAVGVTLILLGAALFLSAIIGFLKKPKTGKTESR